MTLKDFFHHHSDVAIAFSGGVDSSYLLYEGKKHCKRVTAYYVKSQFQPEFEYQDALKLASKLDVDLRIIELDVLANSTIKSNPSNRCYHCKNEIFTAIIENAKKDGFTTIIDGTNASDSENDRPGMKALTELNVLSPLRLCSLTKDNVRKLSRVANLFTWNKYSYSCLATRISTNNEITTTLLNKIEICENALRNLGFSDFRLRVNNNIAVLQITNNDFEKFTKHIKEIENTIKIHFEKVHLDLEMRKGEEI